MRNLLGPNTVTGYCTNVHAGASYAQTLANLETHALAVKRRVSPDEPMGVGLWLSAQAASELIEQNQVDEFAGWLQDNGLLAYTMNGFPYHDFHQAVVKHRVYHPTWADAERLNYTRNLANILARLLPPGAEGSISTVPLGWRPDITSSGDTIDQAAANLRTIADDLAELEQETGHWIHLDLEPEPGCYLDTSHDVVRLFEDHLLPGANDERIRRHLQVCHDICHAAVMFENQTDMLRRYRAAGIDIGKVQVSAAVRAPFSELADNDRAAALDQLTAFQEDRYLHQTVVREANGATSFITDLPERTALHSADSPPVDEWRIHFHVPIYLERFGLLEATAEQIHECLGLLGTETDVRHFEIETYAWSVLPDDLRCEELAEGIAREMQWFRDQATKRQL